MKRQKWLFFRHFILPENNAKLSSNIGRAVAPYLFKSKPRCFGPSTELLGDSPDVRLGRRGWRVNARWLGVAVTGVRLTREVASSERDVLCICWVVRFAVTTVVVTRRITGVICHPWFYKPQQNTEHLLLWLGVGWFPVQNVTLGI
jgi:hypothetical protein